MGNMLSRKRHEREAAKLFWRRGRYCPKALPARTPRMDPNRDPRALETSTCTDVALQAAADSADEDDGSRTSVETGIQPPPIPVPQVAHPEDRHRRSQIWHRQAQEAQADLRRERGRYE